MKLEFADLGDWGSEHDLCAEYEPSEDTLRINTRVLEPMQREQRARFVCEALAHELQHHLLGCRVISDASFCMRRSRA